MPQLRSTSPLLTLLGFLLALLLVTPVFAQEELPEVPQSVHEINQHSQRARELLTSDREGSVASLNAALQETEVLLGELDAPSLLSGLAAISENARSAAASGSQLNLDVQLNLLEGMVARVLFVDTLRSGAAGEDLAQRLNLLGALTGADLQVPGEGAAMRPEVERSIGEQMETVLQGIEEVQTPEEVYPRLGRAYALSLVIQDSPVLEGQLAPFFTQAAQALIDGDQGEFAAALATLRDSARALQQPRAPQPAAEPDVQEDGIEEAAAPVEQEVPTVDSSASSPAPLSRALTVTGSEYAFLEREIAPYWNEANRPLTLLLLGLLALLPLMLMSRAFAGAANASWHLVTAAFVLLLLPILVRGVVALLQLIDQNYPLGFVDPASLDELLTGPFGELGWLLTMLLAILVATLGFYGLAKQFGRLGGQSKAKGQPAEEQPRAVRESHR